MPGAKENTKQAIAKTKDKPLLSATPSDFAKNMMKTLRVAKCDPKILLEKIDTTMEAYHQAKNEEEKKTTLLAFSQSTNDALYIYGLDNHYPVAETVTSKLQPLVIQMTNDLIAEYSCKTTSEKALAELIAGAYGRYLSYSNTLTGSFNVEYLSSEKNGYFTLLGKEADRAYRQFITALTTLKQLKFPTPQINVRTNTAFVAGNQQINSTKEEFSNKGAL
ncbi:MAG: hypothetical protein ACD_22C00127G0017 [uncultured bacterium]|nr:MAG: hypothetical protein ACD_22C00127G0017 [uncultured bacterium]